MADNNSRKSTKEVITALIKSKKAATILTALLITAAATPVVLLNGGKTNTPTNDGKSSVSDSENPAGQTPTDSDLRIDENAGEYVEPTKAQQVSQGVSIPGWGSITIPADSAEIAVDFFNPEENKDLYYLTFELRLPDDSEQGYEVLYTSGLVEPGLHIQKINLERTLESGNYNAVIHVQPYRMDENKTATNNADLKTELIVM